MKERRVVAERDVTSNNWQIIRYGNKTGKELTLLNVLDDLHKSYGEREVTIDYKNNIISIDNDESGEPNNEN